MNELARIAYQSIRRQGKRSILTIIGIFIGIAAVISLLSLGQGLEAAIDEQFTALGSDKIIIQSSANTFGSAGGQISNPLTTRDVRTVAGVIGIQEATYMIVRSVEVRVGDTVGFYFLYGIDTEEGYDLTREFFIIDLQEGRELRSQDNNVAILGSDYARRAVFQNPVRVGDRVFVNGQRFSAVGIFEPLGNPADDRAVTVPLRAARELLDTGDSADMIIARTQPNANPATVAEDVKHALRRERGVREGEEDFTVQTPEDLLNSFNIILIIIRVVLVGIAGISLLVGGINIMNAMYTAVLERTKEIGILKAIGATQKDIKNIFLIESGILGFIGGVFGVAVGLGVAKLIEYIASIALNSPYVNAYISWWLILGGILFAVLVGMASGYFPAKAAAKQNAVESLRYE